MKVVMIIIFLILWQRTLYASSLFMPDSDTAMLVSLVSNTASTVSNTLKILEVANRASDKIDEYNFIAMRRFFIARRIEQHTKDIISTKKMNPKSLGELNQAMIRLKLNLRGLKNSIDFMAKEVVGADDFVSRNLEKLLNSMNDAKEARKQELTSARHGTVATHIQNTAMNTALSTSLLVKIRQDSLDYQNTDLSLKNAKAKEDLRKDQHYRDWIGVKDRGRRGTDH